MTVVVLTVVPVGLRGDLTRWLLEIAPGVYVGTITARVRDRLWLRIIEQVKDGRAIMVYATRNEQHLDFKAHRHAWEPVDYDGIRLMRRPSAGNPATQAHGPSGWSQAARRRRFGT